MKKLIVAAAGAMALAGFNVYGLTVNGIEVDSFNDMTKTDGAAKWKYSAADQKFTFLTPGMVYVVAGAEEAGIEMKDSKFGPAAIVIWDGDVVKRDVKKIVEHLYEIQYDDSGLAAAGEMMEGLDELMSGGSSDSAGCTSCWNGNLVGRNFDWNWDDSDEYIIRMAAKEDRHASLGMAAVGVLESKISALLGDSGMKPEDVLDSIGFWGWMPAVTVDGINDAGVEVNVNVVPSGSAGETPGTNPDSPITLPNIFVVRYVLDNADSPSDAVELLQGANIVAIPDMDTHWMISNTQECYIVECVSNKLVVLKAKDKKAAMTNFHIAHSPHLGDYNVLTNQGCTASDFFPWSAGIERYDRATNGLAAISSRAAMHEHMRNNWFALGFYLNSDANNQDWWSENFGQEASEITDDTQCEVMSNLTGVATVPFPGLSESRWDTSAKKTDVNTNDYDKLGWWYNYRINQEKDQFLEALANEAETGSRKDPKTGKYLELWQTLHSCVYDLEKLELSVMVQENYIPFSFKLSGSYGDWAYGETGWKDPADYGGDIQETLGGSGVTGSYRFEIDADGYEQLVRWTSSMNLSPSRLDAEVAENGQDVLLCAAINKLHAFQDWDHAFSVPVKVDGFEPYADWSGAKLSVSIDNGADLKGANYNLLNASLIVLGSDCLDGDFSGDWFDQWEFTCDRVNNRVNYTTWLGEPMRNFFYRVDSK